jgi:hypothetical protein
MAEPNNVKDAKKLEELLKEVIIRTVDMWEFGEGDLFVEVRDDNGVRKAKIKGGCTRRIT